MPCIRLQNFFQGLFQHAGTLGHPEERKKPEKIWIKEINHVDGLNIGSNVGG